jgi:hypothetical protein
MEIQEIKAKLTLATVLSYYSLKPDKNLRLNCPFHEDKTRSRGRAVRVEIAENKPKTLTIKSCSL